MGEKTCQVGVNYIGIGKGLWNIGLGRVMKYWVMIRRWITYFPQQHVIHVIPICGHKVRRCHTPNGTHLLLLLVVVLVVLLLLMSRMKIRDIFYEGRIISHHITSHHIVSHHIIPHHITSYHITSCNVTRHHYHVPLHMSDSHPWPPPTSQATTPQTLVLCPCTHWQPWFPGMMGLE